MDNTSRKAPIYSLSMQLTLCPNPKCNNAPAAALVCSPHNQDSSALYPLLPGSERAPPLDLSPQRNRERTLAALVRELGFLRRANRWGTQ
jgi:hypothetical protein